MKFYDFNTTYDAYRAAGMVPETTPAGRFYADLYGNALQVARAHREETKRMGRVLASQISTEHQWITASRPYYKLFPDTVEMLTATDLDVPCSVVRLPLSPLLFRFSEGRSIVPCIEAQGGHLRTVLVAEHDDETSKADEISRPQTTSRMLMFWADFGETDIFGAPILTYQFVLIRDESEIFDVVLSRQIAVKDDSYDLGITINDSELQTMIRIVINACLLASSHNAIVEADVLNKHFDRYVRSKDEDERKRIREKAVKLGKRGWTIGREIRLPASTHLPADISQEGHGALKYQQWRRGHWHTYLVGRGRTQRRLQWLKPVVVRPDLPTPKGRRGYKS